MKKSFLALSAVVAVSALPSAAHADLAFNIGAVSDYRFRGISQTRLKPAVQGGIDFSASGFYLGAWASNIKWIKDLGGDDNVEIDVYGGYKGDLIKDSLTYDVGVLTYQYPGNKLNPKAETTEIYGALTYGPATVKYSHALTNTFANPDSKNSYYIEAAATFEIADGWSLAPHVGHQRIRGPVGGIASYWDYSLTVSKDFKGLVPSLAVVGTSKTNDVFYSAFGKELGKTTVVVGLKYNF